MASSILTPHKSCDLTTGQCTELEFNKATKMPPGPNCTPRGRVEIDPSLNAVALRAPAASLQEGLLFSSHPQIPLSR